MVLKAIEAGDYEYANNLGYLYASRHDFKNAEKYYLIAIKNNDYDALNNLAILYEQYGKIEEAEKYYLESAEKNCEACRKEFAYVLQ